MLSTMRALRFGKTLVQRQLLTRAVPHMRLYQARMFSYAAVTEMESQFTSETQKTYASFETSDLSFKSLLEAMENLQKTEMTYQDYSEYYPMADELVHYFEGMLEGDLDVTANQVARLINFGA
jgi:hypothetical protein